VDSSGPYSLLPSASTQSFVPRINSRLPPQTHQHQPSCLMLKTRRRVCPNPKVLLIHQAMKILCHLRMMIVLSGLPTPTLRRNRNRLLSRRYRILMLTHRPLSKGRRNPTLCQGRCNHPVCSHLASTKLGGVMISVKHPLNYLLWRIENRRRPRTKSTIAASIDSDNDDEFAPADMDAAIANSILLLAADPQRLAVLPPLPTAINYTRLPIPEGQQLPQYTPSRYHHSSIPQTPIPAANTILTTIANVYRSSIDYLERKLLMEYYLSIAKSFETNQPSHLVILIGGCITPGGGIALEAGTGAYIQCNPMGSPSYRFTYGALSRALPDCGMDLME